MILAWSLESGTPYLTIPHIGYKQGIVFDYYYSQGASRTILRYGRI